MSTLNTMLLIYASILVINALMSGVPWLFYKTKAFRFPFLIWTFAAINFLLQGLFQATDIMAVISFATYFPCALALTLFFFELSNLNGPSLRHYFIVAAVSWTGMFAVQLIHFDFTWAALFAAIPIAYPMIDAGRRGLKNFKSNPPMVSLYSVILLINGLHFLDYPILRPFESTAIFGFSAALIITFAFSVIIPACTVKKTERVYTQFLEEKVRARTLELEDLNQKLNEAMDHNSNLLSIACHDIASPLMIAKMHVEKVLDAKPENLDPQKIGKSLQKVKISTSIMVDILEQIKKLHMIHLQKKDMNLSPVRIDSVIKEVFELLEDKMQEKNIQLEYSNNSQQNLSVQADRGSLQNNVFLNLATNAIKFSHKGGKIAVKLEETKNTILIKVKDDGIGIPPEMRGGIFDVKARGSRPGTNGELGTGLGLPIVRKCLERFNAQIECQSLTEEDDLDGRSPGTEFTIQFPKAS